MAANVGSLQFESVVEVRYAFTPISPAAKQECTNIFLAATLCDDFIVSPDMQRQRNGYVSATDFDEEQARDRRLLKKMLKMSGFTDPGEAKGLGQAEMVYTACNKMSNAAEDLRRRYVRFVYMFTYLM